MRVLADRSFVFICAIEGHHRIFATNLISKRPTSLHSPFIHAIEGQHLNSRWPFIRFCQLVEADIVTRQTETLSRSSPPFRRPALYL